MLNIVSLVFGFGTSLLLCLVILKAEGEKKSFASFLMWGVLNAIIAFSLYVQAGNWMPVVLYAVTSFLTSICICIKFGMAWRSEDTWIACIALTCMVTRFYVDARYVTIMTTAAVMLVGISQLQDISRNPDLQKSWPWIGFGAAHFCSILAGKEWSVPERLYPTACLLFSLLLILQVHKKSNRTFLNTVF